jgi:serine protease Do
MKDLRFAVFCLGLTAAVGAAVAVLGAQDRFEVRQAPSRGSLMMLDPSTGLGAGGRGSQLGVMVSDLDSKDGAGGVKVDEVTGDSAAEKAGLRAGDVVVEFDGERVRSARQFTRLVQETPEGRTVKIAVMRDGKRQTFDATPEARAFSWNMDIDGDRIRREVERGMRGLREFRVEPPLAFEYRYESPSRGRLGVAVESLSPQLAAYFGVKDGALVSSVTQGSAAEKAGIKAGDVITSVNGDPVHDADSLIREIGGASGTELSIGIMRDKKASTVKATIDKPKGLSPRGGLPPPKAVSPRLRPGAV